MHIDLSAKTCTTNKTFHDKSLFSTQMQKIIPNCWNNAKIDAFGDATLTLGTLSTNLIYIAYMPNNPHSTTGGGALTHIQRFCLVSHKMHK